MVIDTRRFIIRPDSVLLSAMGLSCVHADKIMAGARDVVGHRVRHRIDHVREPVVVLGRGEIDKALAVKAHRVSDTARQKIEQAGGTIEFQQTKAGIALTLAAARHAPIDTLIALDLEGKPYLIVLTWDEGQGNHSCCGLPQEAGGRIATILISPQAKNGFEDATPYTLYSLLKTMAESWHLQYLGHAADPENVLITAPWK